ncbi:unnamed protein product [Protopolystoma xenopodis]|uniref:Uncharacterized protein n=1 Tax=Protopolystoma xenopodis TaxID=117903 RepID=A0A3S5CK98_9PLAT|nr:unnamed protein product [Protopolystoma xenopodis]
MELAALIAKGSSKLQLLDSVEAAEEQAILHNLEGREQLEERLINQHEQECSIVECKNCNFRGTHAPPWCRKKGHELKFSKGTRRYFQCRDCKNRTTTLDRYPTVPCE